MKQRKQWLRRLVWLAGGLILVCGGAYAYWTRPAALRAQLIGAMESAGVRVQSLGDVGYRPWSGVAFHDVELDVSKLLPSTAELPDKARVWFVEYGVVARPLIDVLLGRPTPRRIELSGATINFVMDEWRGDSASEQGPSLTLPDPRTLPAVHVRAAAIRRFARHGGELRLQRHLLMDARGFVTRSEHMPGLAYRIELRQTGGSGMHATDSAALSPSIHLEWNAEALHADSTWLDVSELQAILPPSAWNRLNDVLIGGRARLAHWDRSTEQASLELELDEARIAVPIEARDRVKPTGRFLDLTDVAGRLTYERSEDRAIGFEVRGELRGAPVELTGTADGLPGLTALTEGGFRRLSSDDLSGFSVQLTCTDMVLPTADDHPEFVQAEALPEPARNLIEKYAPRGPVNFSLRLARSEGDAQVQYEGVLEARGAGCRYVIFPYDITDARGAVRFSNDGVTLDGLNGRHGSAHVTVNGSLNDSSYYTGFEIDVRGENVPLDHDLYEALPDSYRDLWRDAAPVGLADIRAVITREQGNPEVGRPDPRVRIDTRLLSGSVTHDGRRLTQANGLIRIEDGDLELHDFHAWIGDSELRAWGTVSDSDGESGRQTDVLIEAANFDLGRAEPAEPGAVDAHIRFEGRGDVWGRVGQGTANDPSAYVIRLTSGTVMGFDAEEAWEVDSGWVRRGPTMQDVMGLQAHRGGAQLDLHGKLPVEADPTLPMNLSIRCPRADIAALMRTLVPPRWVTVRDALGLAGTGGVEVQFDRHREPDGKMKTQAVIDLNAERMKPTPIPLELRDIVSRVRVSDEGFVVESAKAQYGAAGRFEVSGVGGWESGENWTRIDVDARDIDLTPECVGALPSPLSRLLQRMSASGRINTQVGRLRLESKGTDHWDINGHLGFSDASLDLGLPLEKFQGELSGAVTVRPGRLATLDGEFIIDQGTLGGRAIRRWEGRIGRAAGEAAVRLTDIRGRVHGGEISGEAAIDPESGAYELSINLHQLSFAALMNPRGASGGADDGSGGDGAGGGASEPADGMSGAVSGHVFVRGMGGDVATRAGGGELRIIGASALNSAVTKSVVEAQRESDRSVSTLIEQAELRFAWDGTLLRFNRVDLHTSSRRLIGEGSWDTSSGRISFTLIGARREDALRLPLLTDLLELAGRELLQYRITGTAADPQTSVEALHTLTEPVKRMLRGG